MKSILVLLFAAGSLCASAQNIVEDTTIKNAVTAIGKPNGEKSEVKMTASGGSIVSSDGKVKLIFPEGAVSQTTTVSIQPVTNMAPNGNGKAYEMQPSGIIFKKPLQIIFNYSNDELQGNSSNLLGVAMQDEKGQWSSLTNATTDTVAKTLTATIKHFSSYVNFLKAKIEPSTAKVKVYETLRLKITFIYEDKSTGAEDEIVQLGTQIKNAPIWNVNGIPNGNSTSGLISSSKYYTVIYQAPDKIPQQNPVAVSVDFTGITVSIGKKKFSNVKLVSNITIYGDVYEVRMATGNKGGNEYAWGGHTTMRDEGSFDVSLGKNGVSITNIKNNLEVVTNNCTKTILNPTTCTGAIHVAGIKHAQVTPANPPLIPYPIVEIWFIPFPMEITRFNFINCPPPKGFKGGPAKGKMDFSTWQMSLALSAFSKARSMPVYLKFEAKEGLYIFPDYNYGTESGEFFLKFSVTQKKSDY